MTRASAFQLRRIVDVSLHRETAVVDDVALLGEQLCCIICMDAQHEAVLLRCGHTGVCAACAGQLWQSQDRRCPLCRERIRSVLRIVGDDGNGTVTSRARGEAFCRTPVP